jgi:hypothetical protein
LGGLQQSTLNAFHPSVPPVEELTADAQENQEDTAQQQGEDKQAAEELCAQQYEEKRQAMLKKL